MQNPLNNTNLKNVVVNNPHHTRTLVIGLVLLVSVAIILGAFYFIQKNKKDGPLSDKDRMDVISELQKSGAMKDSPITDTQRDQSLEAASKSITIDTSTSITDEQRNEAIKQLNLQ